MTVLFDTQPFTASSPLRFLLSSAYILSDLGRGRCMYILIGLGVGSGLSMMDRIHE